MVDLSIVMLVYQRVCVDHSLFKTLKIDSPPIYQTAPWWPLPSPVAAHDAAPHSASVASVAMGISAANMWGFHPKIGEMANRTWELEHQNAGEICRKYISNH